VEPASRCGLILPVTLNEATPDITRFENRAELPPAVPEGARAALERLLSVPGTVGLAAYEVGREAEGAYLNADVPMPLASVVKVVNLVAYAEAVAAGALDPASWVPLSELERYYLPGTDLRSHSLGLAELRERGLVAYDPPATPLEEIPWLMIRHSSNAASDYLHMLVGQETIEATAQTLGLGSHSAPCPFLGQFLALANHTQSGLSERQALEALTADPAAYGAIALSLAEQFSADEMFREAEIEWRRGRPSSATQAAFSAELSPKGSAADYARLMARISTNQLSSSYVNIIVRRALEWPTPFEGNQERFSLVGYKNGALPGILTTAYYAQRLEGGPPVVVVLFFRGLPLPLYQQWRQSLTHDELARWLLADPAAIPTLRALIGAGQ
jgi:hypothetical protein